VVYPNAIRRSTKALVILLCTQYYLPLLNAAFGFTGKGDSMKKQGLCFVALAILICTHVNAQWSRVSTLNDASLTVEGTNVVAHTTNGFYLTTNQGSAWTQVNSGLKRVTSPAILGTRTFAANEYGVYSSSNNGTT
jgi:hypothetical protein